MKKRTFVLIVAAVVAVVACSSGNDGKNKEKKEKEKTLYVAVEGGKCGFIDKTGKMVIEPQFDVASEFREGLAAVRIGSFETGKVGYIDTEGKFVINPIYDDAYDFSEGLSRVRIGDINTGKWGYGDRTAVLGCIRIPRWFGTCEDWRQGDRKMGVYRQNRQSSNRTKVFLCKYIW